MTEFLHKVVANREYIQSDREQHWELRNAMEESLRLALTVDPWEVSNPVIYPTNEDSGTV
jgi:hypothetical protein